ncbi:MAG: exodeoxyribonuclease V subunit alpha [Acidimicrobiales bacterium]
MTVGVLAGGAGTRPGTTDGLAPFVDAGVLGPLEQQLTAAVARLEPGAGPLALLALALAARAPRFGHVCVELEHVRDQVLESDDTATPDRDLPWPDPVVWARELSVSPIVAVPARASEPPLRPLVWDGRRVYLQRYWHYEALVAGDLERRAAWTAPVLGTGDDSRTQESVERTLDALFVGGDTDGPDLQRVAARRALTQGVAIIAGGPGTGKTHAVVRILAGAHLLARDQSRNLLVALAAPTGKAAARMGEAVRAQLGDLVAEGIVDQALCDVLAATDPTTVHRLLARAGRTRFRHDRSNPLPHDLVIVDETSMVSLPLMAKLLDAIRPDARVVLVGDPFQLASIEAGTVMGDLVGPTDPTNPIDATESSSPAGAGPVMALPLAGRVTELRRRRRFADDSAIAGLADAVRSGEPDRAIRLLSEGRDDARWVPDAGSAAATEVGASVVSAAVEVAEAAVAGDAAAALGAAGRIKVLAAVRRGPTGMYGWRDRIEAAVAAAVPRARRTGRWRLGSPIIVTGNDPVNRVFNGDVGVVVTVDGVLRVALATGDGARLVAPARLEQWETWWAMTIHKSQGSEFPHAVVSLPAPGSPILTRELLYTAVTRARDRLTLIGSEESIREAVGRPVARASGLRDRLWSSTDPT